MLIESVELRASLERLLDGKDDPIGRTHDRAIQACIGMISIHEGKELARLAMHDALKPKGK